MPEPKNKLKILQLYTKYRLQKDAYDPEAENTLNQLKAEENEVHDLDSFIDEIKYIWKGNPWLGGYNKTLNAIFSWPSGYDTFKKSTNPTKDNSIPKFINPKQFIKPAKKQQGGQLNMNEQELQQAFLQYLMQKTGAQNEQQLEQVVQQLGEDGLKQAYAQFMQEMQQQQVQAAKFGAKLNYIRKLNGQCPEGMEMYYYKQGGRLCRKCIQAKQNEEEIEYPSNPIDAFKCGRKMKKKKCEIGGTVDMDKCGAKMKKKKCEDGGIVNIDKCGAKIKKKKCENGGLISFDKCGNKMKKKQQGGDLETSKPTKTNKTPLIVYNDKGKKKVTYVKDQATRDSLYANRYNDQEVQATKPGSYKNGKWTPDRSKSPYKRR